MDPNSLGHLLDQHAAALELYARQWCDTPEDVVQDAFLKLAGLRDLPENPCCLALPGGPQRGHRRGQGRAAAKSSRDGRCLASRCLVRGRPARSDPMRSIPIRPPKRLKSLPIDEREVIIAHLWGGLTFEQIAELAGCSSSTAHRLYSRGLSTLRERLGVPCRKSRSIPS